MSKSEYTTEKLVGLSLEKLFESLSFLKKELFNLRFQQTLGELTNVSRFAKVKKDIARIKTEVTKRKNLENKNA
jgi:large subunit ribosomal protein L29